MRKRQEIDLLNIEERVANGIYNGLTLYIQQNWTEDSVVNVLNQVGRLNEEIKSLRESIELLAKAVSSGKS